MSFIFRFTFVSKHHSKARGKYYEQYLRLRAVYMNHVDISQSSSSIVKCKQGHYRTE